MSLIEVTEDNFENLTQEGNVLVLDFWAEWCGPCKSFAPIFQEVADKNTDVKFGKVDIDAQPELAAAFAVRSIPQIVILKENVVVYSESGSMPASSLQSLIDQAKDVDVSQAQQ